MGLALPAGVRGRNYRIGLGKGAAESIAHANMLFEASTRRSLLDPVWERVGESLHGPEPYKAGLCHGATPLQNATRVDFLNDLLIYAPPPGNQQSRIFNAVVENEINDSRSRRVATPGQAGGRLHDH